MGLEHGIVQIVPKREKFLHGKNLGKREGKDYRIFSFLAQERQ